MTWRAVLIGLLGGVFIAGAGYMNDAILQLTFLVGNHFPISVFGMLIAAVGINQLLGRLRASWRFSAAELALATALVLVPCSIPASGLMRYFTMGLALPAQFNLISPGWQRTHVMEYCPPDMLPAAGKYDPDVMNGFLSGLASREHVIGLNQVPWDKWATPLMTWMPIILLTTLAVICLSLIVHRQWSSRERLQYPIARFATTLLSPDPQTGESVFRNRLFWTGLAALLALHIVNGIHQWFPGSIGIPLTFDLSQIGQKYPIIRQAGGYSLLTLIIYPTVVAFAFFLSTDVSLSLGLANIGFVTVSAILMNLGVEMSEDRMLGGTLTWQRVGSAMGSALLILYTGRRYYADVARQALLPRAQSSVETYAVWAMRLFLGFTLLLVFILIRLGLDWPFAFMTVALILMMFLVMARINAEAGLFFVQVRWQPLSFIYGMFGYHAMGPQALVIMGMVCLILTLDPRECLMPFVTTGLKIAEDQKVRPAATGPFMALAFVLGLAVAVPVVLWANYNYGKPVWDTFGTISTPKFTFQAAEKAVTRLSLSGQLQDSEQLAPLRRILAMKPDRKFLCSAGSGLAAVLLFSFLRLRFPRWPLHPVIFLVWGTYCTMMFSYSFLLGWFIKSAVVKLGGAELYRKMRPLMIGVIAGELLGALLFMIVGAIYYAATGLLPERYIVFPL